MGKRYKSRILALQGLYQFDIANTSLDEIIQFKWVHKKKNPIDILVFAEELITGTVKHINEIDSIISSHLYNWKINKISPIERNILRFSIFSFLYKKEIPTIVTINEAINIAKKFGSENSSRFINGILDNIQKQDINSEK